MPSYNRIEEMDRWDIVNYLRSLQGKIAIAADTSHCRPGETGAAACRAPSRMGPTRPSPYYHVRRADAPRRARPRACPTAPADTDEEVRRPTRRRSRSTSREPSPLRVPYAERSRSRRRAARFPKSLKTMLAGAASASARSIFIVGLFVDPDRAWRAFHVNWLFFTVLSQRRRRRSSPCSASPRRAGRAA